MLIAEGISILMISRGKCTADTPRAHITNVAALECLRDIGLDKQCAVFGTPQDAMAHRRWTRSMLGHEYCRVWSWGCDPNRKVSPYIVFADIPRANMRLRVRVNISIFPNPSWSQSLSTTPLSTGSQSDLTQNSSHSNRLMTMSKQRFVIE